MAAGKALEDIIGYVPLTGSIRTTVSGIPDPLPPAFRTTTRDVLGDATRWIQRTGQRQTARRVEYGAPPLNTPLKEIGAKDAKLLHFYEQIRLPMLQYQSLRAYDNYAVQRMGEQEVQEQTDLFRDRFTNVETAAILMTLAKGILYFDANGNLLPTSSGAILSVTFQMNANNQNQLNGVISTSWASIATADVPAQLRALKQRARFLTGYPIKYAFYGKNVPGYLANNALVQPYLARALEKRQEWLQNAEIPDGLFGLTWVPAYEAFYEDYTGTNQGIFGDDAVVFTPEPSMQWWELQLGSFPVPKSIDITGPAGAPDNFELVYGRFGYGQLVRNPPTADVYYGHTFLPIIKNPDAVFQAVVAF
jgi:Phage major capsid protein E